ncbi:GNAT family N-acetyltransferase [Sphingobacterium faecium]|jgi:GNAT superfamily N-acetyltransferase|uniref:GNAT family N-acetyltransferase n=1 Tax=Sphingobacterium faecium TaxID=34087 RepID=UPI0004E5F610|nr:GNAT family N-acetyltransferase [Sphingobacterium faecium]CDT33487.1 putative diamine N-acetyltransferase [Sphingobacterium sp. PM2-P1-29]SJN49188.1 GCN5-related N-acetyltransferase [Sphingobacterium faecium PCAi_F2.5]HCU45984.1 N-acetyltransferase [Sphingobacterium sp.]UXD71280.1 GNAT family N-acetyltransferase [Sphingobacterium faecium]WGQ14925.1 GNAT family N-acetyltransferase [Sphingobacterium faecium]
MTKAIIRPAVEADGVRMLELIRELAVVEKAPDEVTVSMEEFLDAGFGKNPVWGAFVAEVDEKIVGISLYYIRYSTWKGRRLYLEDLIVTESMRGYGIGKQLFEETLNLGKSQGYHGMVWQVLDWNEPAIQFYKKYKADFDAAWINVSITY